MKVKFCAGCTSVKPLKEFHRCASWKDGRQYRCKVCMRGSDELRRGTPAYIRKKKNRQLRKLYGITLEDYGRMLEGQRGLCLICEAPDPGPRQNFFSVGFHDGEVKGLLCARCRTGLKHFHDDPELLQRALAYL